MKFTATNAFTAYATGSAKVLAWKVYVKNTTVLNEALTTGTWTDVSIYINWDSFPDIVSKIEYEPGQFITDNITLEAKNITWWKANVFTSAFLASTTQFLEIKIQLQIGSGGALATDIVYAFSGWIDKVGIVYDELQDGIIFQAFTAEDLGSRMIAENITTQYINTNIDGASTSGLVMETMPGVFFKNANIASYVLNVGQHIISYQVSGPNKQVRLDGGMWVPTGASLATNTTYTLGNGSDPTLDTQRCFVYVDNVVNLLTSGTVDENIVVITAGTVLPKQWYRNIGARYLLQKIYGQMGIDTVNFDAMTIGTWDGTKRLSWIDAPPADENAIGEIHAMTSDGTNLWLARGNKLYRRITSTGAYELKSTLTSGLVITRIIYNSRNSHVWMYTGGRDTTASTGSKVILYDIGGVRTSNELALQGSTYRYCFDLLDYNYTGTSWKYAGAYVNVTTNDFREIRYDTATNTLTDLLVLGGGTALGTARFIYQRTGGELYFSQINLDYRKMTIDITGAWINSGTVLGAKLNLAAGTLDSASRAFIPGEGAAGRIYCVVTNEFAGQQAVEYHDHNSTAINATTGSAGNVYEIQYSSVDAKIYSAGYINLVSISAAVRTSLVSFLTPGLRLIDNATICSLGGVIYGIDNSYRLYQFGTTISFMAPYANFPGVSVRDALVKVLKAYNLIGIISSTKQAFVYRRGDSAGAAQTTGNILSLTVANSQDIEETISSFQPFALVKITGQSKSITYDGTNYNVNVLSNKSLIEINNSLIDDAIIKDMVYYVYQFFKTAKNGYKIPLANVTLFQYEPFDAINTTFTTTKIIKSIAGTNTPIYGITYKKEGSMEVETFV